MVQANSLNSNLFFKGVQNPEGPVSLANGSWLITEMDASAISQISLDGNSKRIIAQTGKPNGLAVDRNNDIWVADAQWGALLRVTMSGEVVNITKGVPELPFLLPNDLCFGPDHMIYMTDSGISLDTLELVESPKDIYDLDFDGRVFRIDPLTNEVELLDRGFQLTNGIAFGPGGETLYVAETLTGNIYRYWIKNGKLDSGREFFANVLIKNPDQYEGVAGPDGMAFDLEGYLYVTVLVQGDITVISPEGEIPERINIDGTMPTNIAFSKMKQNQALVTESSKNQLIWIKTENDRLPLYE